MGGDAAPGIVLKGADIARQRYPSIDYLLFGDEGMVRPLLAKLPALSDTTTLVHTNEIIADDAKPSVALRSGRGSSMRLAIDAVEIGRAHV